MKTVTIYGSSDDLIEVEGAISAEFYAKNFQDMRGEDELEGGLLAFSDGTVLEIVYGSGVEAFWRIRRLLKGTSTYELEEATDADDDYSDRVTLTGDNLKWVVFGTDFVRA